MDPFDFRTVINPIIRLFCFCYVNCHVSGRQQAAISIDCKTNSIPRAVVQALLRTLCHCSRCCNGGFAFRSVLIIHRSCFHRMHASRQLLKKSGTTWRSLPRLGLLFLDKNGFEPLEWFLGGLAAAFPGIVTFETDF